MLAIKLFLTILAGTDDIPGIIASVLFMAGLWRMFQKSGLKGWQACNIGEGAVHPHG